MRLDGSDLIPTISPHSLQPLSDACRTSSRLTTSTPDCLPRRQFPAYIYSGAVLHSPGNRRHSTTTALFTISDYDIKPHARSSEQSTTGAMPFQLDTPVLTVDKGIIHKVDTGNPQNLFSMWTGEYAPTSFGRREYANQSSLLQVRRLRPERPEARVHVLALLEQGDDPQRAARARRRALHGGEAQGHPRHHHLGPRPAPAVQERRLRDG